MIHIYIHICIYNHYHVSYIYILFQILFHYGKYKILNIVPCATVDPSLFIYFIYSKYISINPKLLIYLSPTSSLIAISLFSMSISLFLFCK